MKCHSNDDGLSINQFIIYFFRYFINYLLNNLYFENEKKDKTKESNELSERKRWQKSIVLLSVERCQSTSNKSNKYSRRKQKPSGHWMWMFCWWIDFKQIMIYFQSNKVKRLRTIDNFNENNFIIFRNHLVFQRNKIYCKYNKQSKAIDNNKVYQ